MHNNARVVVSEVGILPTGVHHASVIHHYGVPVGVLVEGYTTQVTGLRSIEYEVAYRVAPIDTRHALITDVGDGQNTSVGQIRTVVEFKVRLFIIDKLFQAGSVQFYFEHVPAFVLAGLGKHHAVTVPVQAEVGDRRTVRRLIHLTHPNVFATNIGEFHNLGVKAVAAGRFLIAPIVGLRSKVGSHYFTCSGAYLIAGSDNFVTVQQWIPQ